MTRCWGGFRVVVFLNFYTIWKLFTVWPKLTVSKKGFHGIFSRKREFSALDRNRARIRFLLMIQSSLPFLQMVDFAKNCHRSTIEFKFQYTCLKFFSFCVSVFYLNFFRCKKALSIFLIEFWWTKLVFLMKKASNLRLLEFKIFLSTWVD